MILCLRPENREKLSEGMLPKRLLDKVNRDAPPAQNGADDPEVRGYFHARSDSASVGKEAAGNGCSGGEGCEDSAKDKVAG